MQAVKPEPHEKTKGWLFMLSFLNKTSNSSSPLSLPFSNTFLKERFFEFGILPLLNPSLGSGAVPRKRPSERASITSSFFELIFASMALISRQAAALIQNTWILNDNFKSKKFIQRWHYYWLEIISANSSRLSIKLNSKSGF